MSKYFDGFDDLKVGVNGFELFKDGRPYLSLYHDCKLLGFEYVPGSNFTLFLQKVHDSGYGPEFHSSFSLILDNAQVNALRSNGEGNFEDVNGLALDRIEQDILYLDITIGALVLSLSGTRLSLVDDK